MPHLASDLELELLLRLVRSLFSVNPKSIVLNIFGQRTSYLSRHAVCDLAFLIYCIT